MEPAAACWIAEARFPLPLGDFDRDIAIVNNLAVAPDSVYSCSLIPVLGIVDILPKTLRWLRRHLHDRHVFAGSSAGSP